MYTALPHLNTPPHGKDCSLFSTHTGHRDLLQLLIYLCYSTMSHQCSKGFAFSLFSSFWTFSKGLLLTKSLHSMISFSSGFQLHLTMKAYPNNHTSKTFAKGRFIEPFMELYSILGKGGEDVDIDISTDNYVEGTCLLPLDVTLTSAGKTGGNCRMELQFCNPLHKIT